MKLYTKILIGMVAGILVGYLYNIFDLQFLLPYTDWVGTIFINLVKMVVVPLVVVSLILGSASLGDIRKVGKMGAKAFGFFMFTTAVAVIIGLGVGNLVRPGDGLPEDKKEILLAKYSTDAEGKTGSSDAAKFKEDFQESSTAEKLFDLMVSFVPTNPLKAMTEGEMLGVIFFSLFLGICITMIDPEKADFLVKFFDGTNDAIIKMVTLAMEAAPYGVFALMIGVVADLGLDILGPLVLYGVTVLLGLALHVMITHSSFIYFYTKQSPWVFFQAIKEAVVMAFSTSSSSATLPISMNLAQTNLGVSRQVSSFVLPLGATINMDGTALYQAVAALFIAQVFQIPLDLTAQLTIILTATLASVGAAGVPGAGMITLALVLGTLGIPEEGIALIFGLDRLLDMCRTVVNIFGDLTLTMVLAKSEGETINIQLDKDIVPG